MNGMERREGIAQRAAAEAGAPVGAARGAIIQTVQEILSVLSLTSRDRVTILKHFGMDASDGGRVVLPDGTTIWTA